MKRFLGVFVAIIGLIVGGGVAYAATPDPHGCIVDSTPVLNHDDSGNNGNWAKDSFTRYVKICEAGASDVYHATVSDEGGFTTIPGAKSPNAGTPIHGVVSGSMKGGFTADFKSAPGFAAYTGVHGNTTSTWVAGYFSDYGSQSSINNDWAWKYDTACEEWVDSAANGDGHMPADGDVTGKACPTPTPTPTPSPVATPTPQVSPSATPGIPTSTPTPASAVPGLPSTGFARTV